MIYQLKHLIYSKYIYSSTNNNPVTSVISVYNDLEIYMVLDHKGENYENHKNY